MQPNMLKVFLRGGRLLLCFPMESALLISCSQNGSKGGSGAAGDAGKKPDDNRFTPVVLTQEGDFDEPLNFEVLKDGRVYINERKGALKLFDPLTKTVKLVANIPVNTK